jgi:hypothetical protein
MLVIWIAELVRALPSERCNEECDDATQETRFLFSRLYTPVIEVSSETPHECVRVIDGYEIVLLLSTALDSAGDLSTEKARADCLL